ncbi:MAG: hypothetical protein DRP97_00735 [Candidatus Latescibacterota bacterium]|nr:MAG: hypothetical protein DRP97_00735 [Candidatus Latescibacterota bacterium]
MTRKNAPELAHSKHTYVRRMQNMLDIIEWETSDFYGFLCTIEFFSKITGFCGDHFTFGIHASRPIYAPSVLIFTTNFMNSANPIIAEITGFFDGAGVLQGDKP